jgi:hypothetical protein
MMRRTLFTTVAAGALTLGLSAAFAQSGPAAGGADSPSSQLKPPPAASAPASRSDEAPGSRSSAAPGSRMDSSTGSRAESAPGSRSDEAPASRADTAPGQKKRQDLSSGGTEKDAQSAASTSRSGENSDKAMKRQSQDANAPRSAQPSNASAATETKGDRDRVQQRSSSTSSDESDAPQRSSSSTTGSGDTDRTSTSAARSGSAEASGSVSAAVDLKPEQRVRVTEAFTRRDIEPVTNVSFSISVGTAVTDSVRLYEVPADVVQIVPQYRGYRYFVVRDEIVIVHPRTKKIVEVIHKSDRRSASARSGSVKLTKEQRRSLRDTVMTTGSTRTTTTTTTTIDLREGVTLPETVELREVPTTIISEAPELRTYRYVVIGDDIGLVDPSSRRVVTIVEE